MNFKKSIAFKCADTLKKFCIKLGIWKNKSYKINLLRGLKTSKEKSFPDYCLKYLKYLMTSSVDYERYLKVSITTTSGKQSCVIKLIVENNECY